MCEHRNTELILTPELKHHGKEVCRDCGRFVRWVAKPETNARHAANAQKLVALRNCDRLTEWECSFVESLEGQGPKFSPKQQDTLDKIARERLA